MSTVAAHRAGNARWYLKNKPQTQQAFKKWKGRNPDYYLWLNAKKRANSQELEFDLSVEWVKTSCAAMRCSETGLPLSWTWDGPGKNPWAPSIDRIDNSKGYISGNVRVVCWIYNLSKSTWTDDIVSRFRAG